MPPQGVADVLGITEIKQLADDAGRRHWSSSPQTKWNVVAIVGADKSN